MAREKKIETENHVKALVKDWYDKRVTWHYAPVQNGMGVQGIPDRIGCVGIRITSSMVGKVFGLFVAVESKRPGRKGEKDRGMTKHQVTNLVKIREAGGLAIVCDGQEDLDQLEKVIHNV